MLSDICEVMKEAYIKGWISTRDGNASFRSKTCPFLYVTPSGVRKQHLNSEMMIKLELCKDKSPFCACDIHNVTKYGINALRVMDKQQDKIIGLDPTGELPLHLLLQKTIPQDRVVLHLHPTYIIAAMYAGLDLQKLGLDFPEISRFTHIGPSVPVVPPVSDILAYATIEALGLNKETGHTQFDIVGLKQHGVVVVAQDAWSAYEHVERVESICQVILAAGKDAYQHYIS